MLMEKKTKHHYLPKTRQNLTFILSYGYISCIIMFIYLAMNYMYTFVHVHTHVL